MNGLQLLQAGRLLRSVGRAGKKPAEFGSGDKKNIYKNVVMSKTEAEELNVLHQGGVDIFMQPIPEDNPYPFKDALAKF